VPADLESERLAGQPFERFGMARRRPQFQLRLTGGADLQQVVVAAVVHVDAADDLSVAAIQAFGKTQHRRETADGSPGAPLQFAESIVIALGRRLPVIAGNQRNLFDLVRLEATQIAIANQVIRMFVMPLVTDVHTDVVKDRGVFQPFALAIGHTVNAAGLIE
jgi:hypothetical protein